MDETRERNILSRALCNHSLDPFHLLAGLQYEHLVRVGYIPFGVREQTDRYHFLSHLIVSKLTS